MGSNPISPTNYKTATILIFSFWYSDVCHKRDPIVGLKTLKRSNRRGFCISQFETCSLGPPLKNRPFIPRNFKSRVSLRNLAELCFRIFDSLFRLTRASAGSPRPSTGKTTCLSSRAMQDGPTTPPPAPLPGPLPLSARKLSCSANSSRSTSATKLPDAPPTKLEFGLCPYEDVDLPGGTPVAAVTPTAKSGNFF